MIHNFKKYLEEADLIPPIKTCLLDLYKAEEEGKADPSKTPSIALYEITIDKYYEIYREEVSRNEA